MKGKFHFLPIISHSASSHLFGVEKTSAFYQTLLIISINLKKTLNHIPSSSWLKYEKLVKRSQANLAPITLRRWDRTNFSGLWTEVKLSSTLIAVDLPAFSCFLCLVLSLPSLCLVSSKDGKNEDPPFLDSTRIFCSRLGKLSLRNGNNLWYKLLE